MLKGNLNASQIVQKRYAKEAHKQETTDNKMLNARYVKKQKESDDNFQRFNELDKQFKDIISQIKPHFQIINNLEQIKVSFLFLYYMLLIGSEKVNRKGNLIYGLRYPLYIIPYVLLLSLFGKKLVFFLHIILAFPVWKTIVDWRKKYIAKYQISLDGEDSSIDNLINLYMSGINDNRVVLAIDAASVSARVSVSKDGVIKGLLNTKFTQDAKTILSSSQEFAKFIEKHQQEIIRYFFVIYACPLSPSAQAFPVALIPKTSGNANKDIVAQFKKIIRKVSSRLTVVGTAFDGDAGWLPMAKKAEILTKDMIIIALFKNEQLQSLDYYLVLRNNEDSDSQLFLIFEDMLHLLKCFRYRLCSGCSICPSVFSDDNNFINCCNLESVGIPSWLIDNSKYLKMDNGMPLKLFTFENVEKCILSDRINLAYALIPCTLLKDTVMNPDADRETRIEMISLGYSIVFLYFNELEKFSKYKKSRLQSTSKRKGKNLFLTLMDKKWCAKYLSLSSSLAFVLKDKRAVELGALGSHCLEHFFGLIRTTSRSNDTFEKFEYSVYNSILSTFLEKEIGIKLTSPKRVSSSGVRLDEASDVFGINLTIPLKMAMKLHLSLSSGVYCKELFQKIEQIPIDFEIGNEIEYIMLLLNSSIQTPNVRTTFSERITVSVCKSQRRNLSLASKLTKNIEDNDNDSTASDQSFTKNSVKTRKSPRKRKMISDTMFAIEDDFISIENTY